MLMKLMLADWLQPAVLGFRLVCSWGSMLSSMLTAVAGSWSVCCAPET
jgi:hypothetical protein